MIMRAVFIVLVVAILLGGIGYQHEYAALTKPSDIQISKSYWISRIQKVGDQAARKELIARQDASSNQSTRHVQAHSFGSALYATEGIEGIRACGTDFLFGCSHELVGEAIQDKGVSAVQQINKVCLRSPERASCTHSIGHGITALIGYTPASVPKIVQLCNSVIDDIYHQCADGAFMEYFMGLIPAQGSFKLHAIDPKDPYSPCDTVTGDNARACYYDAPQWWTALNFDMRDNSRIFQIAISRCAGLEGAQKQFRGVCMRGVGYAAALHVAEQDLPGAQKLCLNALMDPSNRLECSAGLAYTYSLGHGEATIGDACSKSDESVCKALTVRMRHTSAFVNI